MQYESNAYHDVFTSNVEIHAFKPWKVSCLKLIIIIMRLICLVVIQLVHFEG